MSAETEAADDGGEEAEEENSNPLDDEEKLRELYEEEGLTQAEIGEQFDVTASTVSHYMRKHDIEARQTRVSDERLEDEEWLREKYEDEELTMQEIADEIGCSDGTVMRRLHQIDGLEIRRSRGEGDDEDEDEAEGDANEDEGEADEGGDADDGSEDEEDEE